MNKSSSPVRVLLVEDDEAQATLLAVQMRHVKTGAPEIHPVFSLQEAALRLREQSFDVILLDLSLPDGFGIETLSSMQALAQETPIVIYSGLDDEQVREEALRMGAAGFIVKGEIGPDELAQTLEETARRLRE